jgi:RNA polymerase sigma factor (sigma-70 family)
LSAQQREWIVGARPGAVRTALRLAAGNRLGLTRDDLKALAEDGLIAAARKFDPSSGPTFDVFSFPYVRGRVLNALRARRRRLAREIAADTSGDARALLDDLGAGLDADACDPWEDTDEDFAQRAQELADDGILIVLLGRAARGAEGSLIKRELLGHLDAALATLGPAHERLVRMRFYEGLTLDQISAASGVPPSTLHLHLGQILACLRKRIGS